MLPSEVRLEPHDLRTGRAAAYITAECLPLLLRERFSPLRMIRNLGGGLGEPLSADTETPTSLAPSSAASDSADACSERASGPERSGLQVRPNDLAGSL